MVEEPAPVEEKPLVVEEPSVEEKAPAKKGGFLKNLFAAKEEVPAENAPEIEEDDLSEEAMTRELEESINRILSGVTEEEKTAPEKGVSQETRVIKPF